jgi:alginate O-acetyltransferase complex protein AlgI
LAVRLDNQCDRHRNVTVTNVTVTNVTVTIIPDRPIDVPKRILIISIVPNRVPANARISTTANKASCANDATFTFTAAGRRPTFAFTGLIIWQQAHANETCQFYFTFPKGYARIERMTFISPQYLLFFPTVVIIYFLLPQRYRWILLLLASYYFYAAWRLEYTLLILFSTTVDYFAGRQMGRLQSRSARRPYLILSLVVNLGLLFAFKYANFFNDSLRQAFSEVNILYDVPAFDFLLPVGISFYTFQTLSYTIDVYRGKLEPETHFGIFALYVSFFPQLVAGPIERAVRLLPQLRREHRFEEERVISGLRLILWGVFKKVVIADRLAIYVNNVYGSPEEYAGLPILLATYFFAFQIYCDFSGYTDIAIGSARVLGINLMRNFRQPYMARSIPDFWRRWHISLSSWFRDYFYIPLGGSRVSIPRWYLNVLLVFLVSGLWHGASWTFVIWGGLHGLYVVMGHMLNWTMRRVGRRRGMDAGLKLPGWLNIFVTFHLVTFAWIFFRAETLSGAVTLVRNLVQPGPDLSLQALYAPWVATAVNPALEMSLSIVLIFLIWMIQWIDRRKPQLASFLQATPVGIRWAAYLAGVLIIFNFGMTHYSPFIYFQF